MAVYVILGAAVLLILMHISLYNELRRLSVKVEEGSAGIDVALEKRYDLLSEEIEAVKKFLKHEYDTYLGVTAVRAGKEREEQAIKEKSAVSQQALKAIDDVIAAQQEQMQRIKQEMAQKPGFEHEPQDMQAKREAYHMSAAEQKMNLNQKVGILTSIQQGLGGVGAAINALTEQYPVLYSHVSMDYFQRCIRDTEEHLQAARRLYNSNVSIYNQKIVTFPYSLIAAMHGMRKAEFYQVDEKKKDYQVRFD